MDVCSARSVEVDISQPAKDSAGHPSLKSLLWGRLAQIETPSRVMAVVFVMAVIASMSYCQLGFWPIGTIDDKPVYLMLIVAPVVMGALVFGPLMGALLGLFAGAVVFSHASLFALDYYEVYFVTVLNSFALLTLLGICSGFLFSLTLRKAPTGWKRFGLIALICVVISFAASGLMMLNVVIAYGYRNIQAIEQYLFNSPLGVAVQALVDAALMMVLCWAADYTVSRAIRRGNERTLLSIFRNWMILVSSVVFMLLSAAIFTAATVQAQITAESKMFSEVKYLQTQADPLQEGADASHLLEGYEVPLDGYVLTFDEQGIITATDDAQRYPVGESFIRLLGLDDLDSSSQGEIYGYFKDLIDANEMIVLQAANEDGSQNMDECFLAIGYFGKGYVAALRTPEMVYANRFGTMIASTLLALALILATGILATVLLNRVVVRRVDETNDSLSKITGGNLDERVKVHDTREFTSLSRGINTTVSSLKDTIAEVEQRNAQDLATAKAIQESTLPREFPPFPDIDKFDIYASMKTAKEVGGDFYDFFLVENDGGANRLAFVIADVSGKGIPAALFMMTAKTQIRNFMEAGLPVDEAVNAANHQLCIGNDAGMFVTVWVGLLDYETGLLTYVNGGHNPPLLQTRGAWTWMKDVSGMPLGLFDGMPYDAYTCQLEPHDVLYLYTDGVTEAMDIDGELFGEDRLQQALDEYSDMNPRSICVGIRRSITDFTLDAEQSDDITMLALKYGDPPGREAIMILPANVKQLVHVCNFIHEELKRRRAPKSVYNPLDIAAEELFVNVCHYAYPHATPEEPGEVRIGFEYQANPPMLTVTISDTGIPYNPLAKPDAVTPDNVADVPIGGLGILMAKRSVDSMTYERVHDTNVLTFTKGW